MCGITGIVAQDRLTTDERTAVRGMTARLSHRGPDDAGHYFDHCAGLGHRRLAIIDRAGGRQPISNEDGTIWCVFNGQIYNHGELRMALQRRGHVFATRGDAETIVHAYEEHGDEFASKLVGMFAIALWDTRRRKLLLVRDRLGVKPLYYRAEDRRVIFGSELKAVLDAPGVPRRTNVQALADYLAFGFIPSPRTILDGVNKLEPGQMLTYERGRATLRTWWRLEHSGFSRAPAEALREELWAHLESATRCRLESEVPLGVLLSGGVDSAATAFLASGQSQCKSPTAAGCIPVAPGVQGGSLARKSLLAPSPSSPSPQSPPLGEGAFDGLTTCTIGFDESAFDERDAAREVADAIGSWHVERVVRADAARLLPRLAHHFDEPFADASALPCFALAEAARPHLTVAISGDGGDEILAGYRRYRFDLNEQRVRAAAPAWLRRGVFGAAARVYPSGDWLPRPLRARVTLANLADDGAGAHARSIARMDAAAVRTMLHPDLRRALGEYDPFDVVREAYRACDAPHHLARCQHVDIRLGLGDGILTKVDRAFMAHGVEVRSPMLDHRFVQFAASIPPSLRMRGGHGKRLLREALERRMGERFAQRRKQGFAVPLDDWFRARPELQARLKRAARSLSDGWLNGAAIDEMFAQHAAGRRRLGANLWSVAMLDEWVRQFAPEISAPAAHGVAWAADTAATCFDARTEALSGARG